MRSGLCFRGTTAKGKIMTTGDTAISMAEKLLGARELELLASGHYALLAEQRAATEGSQGGGTLPEESPPRFHDMDVMAAAGGSLALGEVLAA
jgi:hypothetical protein